MAGSLKRDRRAAVPLASLPIGSTFFTVATERCGEILGMAHDGSFFVGLGPSLNYRLGHEQKSVHPQLMVWQADREYRKTC